MIQITEIAQSKLNEYMQRHSVDSPIRIFVDQSSCSGPRLDLALGESNKADEETKVDGLTFLIESSLSEQVGAVNVDFIDHGTQSHFVVSSENPVADFSASCEMDCGGCCC